MKPSVAVISLGCAKNLVDAEAAVGALLADGYALTTDASGADVVLVNTCAFIGEARAEARQVISEVSREVDAGATLVVIGCFAQHEGERLRWEFPRIDAVRGVGPGAEVAAAVRAARAGKRSAAVGAPRPSLADDLVSRPRLTAPHVSFVKVADGCDHPCTFCIIPRLRGPFRSRPADDVVREADEAAGRGVVELVLVAQDTSRYGEDRGERDGLARLLRRLGAVGVRWLRVLYLHPARVTDGLLETFATLPQLAEYFDLPLQHASPRLLAAMGRPATTPDETLAQLARIRAAVPGAALRTTFIVGFPGETDADFRLLADFAGAARFDHVGVFAFSPEAGTPAAALPGAVAPAETDARRAELLLLQQRIIAARYRDMVGARYEVLLDGAPGDGRAVGRTYFQAPEVDPVTCVNGADGRRPGEFVAATVVGHDGYELLARVGAADAPRHAKLA